MVARATVQLIKPKYFRLTNNFQNGITPAIHCTELFGIFRLVTMRPVQYTDPRTTIPANGVMDSGFPAQGHTRSGLEVLSRDGFRSNSRHQSQGARSIRRQYSQKM